MALAYNVRMIDQKRIEILFSTAEAMGLRPKLLTKYGLVAIKIDSKERYLYYNASNPNTQLASWLSTNKHASRVILERNGLPNIPFQLPINMTEAQNFLAKHKKVIAKPIAGQHSKDIHLISDKDELEKLDIQKYILEKYVKGDEMRYLVIDGKVMSVHRKAYDSPINNPEIVKRISINKVEWDDKHSDITIKTAEIFGLKFTVVDFLVTTDGEAYILEINSAPGLDRFQVPTEGPSIDIVKIFLEKIVENYRN